MTDVEETWVANLRAEMDRQYKMGYADALRHYADALRVAKPALLWGADELWGKQLVEPMPQHPRERKRYEAAKMLRALAEMGEKKLHPLASEGWEGLCGGER
jgi:hypothetical protein